jgi:hypothetical protein
MFFMWAVSEIIGARFPILGLRQASECQLGLQYLQQSVPAVLGLFGAEQPFHYQQYTDIAGHKNWSGACSLVSRRHCVHTEKNDSLAGRKEAWRTIFSQLDAPRCRIIRAIVLAAVAVCGNAGKPAGSLFGFAGRFNEHRGDLGF